MITDSRVRKVFVDECRSIGGNYFEYVLLACSQRDHLFGPCESKVSKNISLICFRYWWAVIALVLHSISGTFVPPPSQIEQFLNLLLSVWISLQMLVASPIPDIGGLKHGAIRTGCLRVSILLQLWWHLLRSLVCLVWNTCMGRAEIQYLWRFCQDEIHFQLQQQNHSPVELWRLDSFSCRYFWKLILTQNFLMFWSYCCSARIQVWYLIQYRFGPNALPWSIHRKEICWRAWKDVLHHKGFRYQIVRVHYGQQVNEVVGALNLSTNMVCSKSFTFMASRESWYQIAGRSLWTACRWNYFVLALLPWQQTISVLSDSL